MKRIDQFLSLASRLPMDRYVLEWSMINHLSPTRYESIRGAALSHSIIPLAEGGRARDRASYKKVLWLLVNFGKIKCSMWYVDYKSTLRLNLYL